MNRSEVALTLVLKAIDKGDYTISGATTNEDIAKCYVELYNAIFENLSDEVFELP